MNREDILRMAREAGIDAERDTLCRYEGFVEPLERFAALVAAAAKAEEREACAKVCEAEADTTDAHLHMCIDALRDCADAIRARGQS